MIDNFLTTMPEFARPEVTVNHEVIIDSLLYDLFCHYEKHDVPDNIINLLHDLCEADLKNLDDEHLMYLNESGIFSLSQISKKYKYER